MFWQTFHVVLLATLQVMLLGASGYFLVKRKILDQQGLAQVSALTVNFLLPLFTFYQLSMHFDFKRYPNWWIFPLASFFITAAGLVLGKIVASFSKDPHTKDELLALITFQNSGNIPLTIITALFAGEIMHQMYIQVLLFVIGTNITVWTLGVRFMTNAGPKKMEWDKILNPPFIAIMLALVAVLFGLPKFIPMVVLTPIKLFGDCALPLAMLVLGGNLAFINFAHTDKRSLVLAVVAKLIALPLIAMAVISLWQPDYNLGFIVVMQAAVPSAVTLSLIIRYYNVEGRLTNQGLLFTHLLSLITLPIFLTWYMQIAQGFIK